MDFLLSTHVSATELDHLIFHGLNLLRQIVCSSKGIAWYIAEYLYRRLVPGMLELLLLFFFIGRGGGEGEQDSGIYPDKG